MKKSLLIPAWVLLAVLLLGGCGGARKDRNGYNPITNRSVEIAFLRCRVPDYFEEASTKGEAKVYVSKNNTEEALLLLNAVDVSIADAKFITYKEELLKELLSGMELRTTEDVKTTSFAGMTGAAMDFTARYDGRLGEGRIVCLNRPDTRIYCALVFQFNLSEYDYFPDFDRILASAELLPEPTPTPEPTPEPKSEKASGTVDPDLKAMLDEYEAFVDEYVKFMKSYSTGSAGMNDMMKYLNFLSKYADFAEKADAVDEKNLSDADYLYYSQAMLRISQKLLEAAG